MSADLRYFPRMLSYDTLHCTILCWLLFLCQSHCFLMFIFFLRFIFFTTQYIIQCGDSAKIPGLHSNYKAIHHCWYHFSINVYSRTNVTENRPSAHTRYNVIWNNTPASTSYKLAKDNMYVVLMNLSVLVLTWVRLIFIKTIRLRHLTLTFKRKSLTRSSPH